MEMNVFKNICGSIDHNTYKSLQNTLGMSTIGLAVANELTSQYPLINNSIDILSYTTLVAYLGMVLTKGKEYTKDIKQIRELYNYFLNNYNKLNKIFDLSNPVEIHTMFNYLLYKGYLSKDKEFQFSGKQARDLNGLSGVNVIAGKAVCRHISGMLTDILNEYGIESSQLGVYSKNYSININILKEQKHTKEELVNWVRMHITDEQIYEFVMKLIDELIDSRNKNIEISSEMIDDKNILKRKIGNHAISFAFIDGKSYFLDPTQTRIYRMKESNGDILYDSECDEIPIRLLSSILLNDLKGYLQMKKRLSNPCSSISLEEEQALIKATLDKCKNNMDIFEQFYADNCELYDDISSKILKLRTNKII